MDTPTKTKTQNILTVLHIVAYVALIGFAIKAGAILVSYGVSWFNEDAAKNIYGGMDLYDLRQADLWQYSIIIALMVALPAMKAYISFLTIKTLSKVNLSNPFTTRVVCNLEKISHVLLGIFILVLISTSHTRWLAKRDISVHLDHNAGEYIFMAALVFIIAQIFKRGVELQSENDLTI